ncbi:metallophosphoesterase family protein [Clostridium sp. 19966]|uniref:metallophosphoesterase family protein n=1 Tax=Clostridium sp. 19966 TaxID=2768166 RepID=UPI0028DDAED2|nr:metallophosphoesterase family protein [Clostridium sp. 19966]MDT8718906.1 metallophosphoesterase family protein [Clostridium sp. 19966]
MKHSKKIAAITLLMTVTLSLTQLPGRSGVKVLADSTNTTTTITNIVLSPGANSSELYLNWYSNNASTASIAQFALKSDYVNGVFPEGKAKVFMGTKGNAKDGFSYNKVTANGFKDSTEYVYRVGDGTNWSPIYNYTTHQSSSFSFFVAGDPQIGASGDINKDSAGWSDTLKKATGKFPGTNFLLSVGDQVNNGKEVTNGENEVEYTGYLAPDQLRSLPVATIAGNHETYGSGHIYHFNSPNMSTQYGTASGEATTGGDAYFTYGDTLFLMLDSNDTNEDGHKTFMEQAIKANPNAKWKIAVLHHSVYSSANHETDQDIIDRRNSLPQIFDSLGIDVVLDGHDHEYTRTYQMKGGQAQLNQTVDKDGSVINPTGTLYVTTNSASGSKYYELRSKDNNYYEAVKQQLHEPTFSLVSMTADSFTITTYRTDDMSVTDSYTIKKVSAPNPTPAPNPAPNPAPQDNNVTVDIKSNPVVSKDVFNSIKGQDKTLTINGNNITWTFNGKDITSTVTSDIDFSLATVSDSLKAKESAKVKAITGKDTSLFPFSFTYSGQLPGKATVKILAGSDWANKAVSVCRYYSDKNTYETLTTTTVDASGYFTFTTDHCSDYFITSASNMPQTGSFLDQNVMIALGILLISAGGAVLIIARKRKARA